MVQATLQANEQFENQRSQMISDLSPPTDGVHVWTADHTQEAENIRNLALTTKALFRRWCFFVMFRAQRLPYRLDRNLIQFRDVSRPYGPKSPWPPDFKNTFSCAFTKPIALQSIPGRNG